MSSRSFIRVLKTQLSRQLTSPTVQRRSIVSASEYARAGLSARLQPTVSAQVQHVRGLKQIDFAGTKETVYGRFGNATSEAGSLLTP